VFRFSSWLRKNYPGLFGTSKRRAPKKHRSLLRLEALESRLIPSVTVNTNFPGMNVNDAGGFVPPDSNGAAGSGNTYIQTANQAIAIYNKSTGSRNVLDSFTDFWYNKGGLSPTDANSFLSDPIILWDDQIGRFIVGDQDVDFSNNVSSFDIAVSKSADPASVTKNDWIFMQVSTTETNYGADYPGNFGYNHDVFTFTLNMFGPANHVLVTNVDISSMLAGKPVAHQLDISSFSLRPTVMHDSKAGDPMWLIGDAGDGQNINVFRIDKPDTASASSTEFTLAVTPFSEITQFGLGAPLEPDGGAITSNIDSRIMKAAEMGSKLVASQGVTDAAGDRDFARWYEIDVSDPTNPTILDQANFTDPTTGAGQLGVFDVYPTVDINASGDIGMTYIQSGIDSPTDFMSAYDTGRLAGDPAGTMSAAALVAGGPNGGLNFDGREGDMNGINVDLSNGSFWATTEWTDPNSNWVLEGSNFTVKPVLTSVDLTSGSLSVNDVLPNLQNNLTITQVSKNLGGGIKKYVQVSDPNIELTATGGAIQVDPHTVVAPLTLVTQIAVGPLDGNDSLQLDFGGGNFAGVPISYDGGSGTNTLSLVNDNVQTATYAYNDGISGTIDLDGQGITFANTALVSDGDTNTHLVFDLLPGAQAALQDDSTANNGVSELASLNNKSVPTAFGNPTSSLTVTTDGGSSLVQLGSMDTKFGTLTEIFNGLTSDVFQFTAAGAVPGGVSVSVLLATLDLNGVSPIINALNGNGQIIDSAASTTSVLTVGGNSGSGTFTGVIKNGSGTVGLAVNGTSASETLSGANTYSGPTTITAGTLVVGVANTVPSTSDVTVNGTLNLNGHNETIGALGGTGTLTSTASALITLTVGATGDSGTFVGVIQNGKSTLSLVVNGTGAVETLGGHNTYTGTTTITSGTLAIGASGTIPATSDVTVNGTLDMDGNNDTIGLLTGSGTLTNSAAGAGTLTVGATGKSGTFSGVIKDGTGTVGLTVNGATVSETLTGANTYSGATTITAGTLIAGAANTIPAKSDVNVTGTLDLDGHSDAIGALSGSGTVTSSVAGSVTLSVGGSGDNGTFSGTLSDGSGTMSLSKVGAGKETLTGASNSYSGATLVSAGSLEVDGTIGSNVTVSGTGTLTGTGTVGNVTATGGAVAPVDLTSNTLSLNAGSAFNASIGGNTPGTLTGHFSQDTVSSGTVSIDTTGKGVVLNLVASGYTPQTGDEYILINNSGGSNVTGTFVAGTGIDAVAPGTPLPEGTIISNNFLGSGFFATISYDAGPNQDSVAIIMQKALTGLIGAPSASVTAAGPVSYTIKYIDADNDFTSSTLTPANVHLVSTGTATGTLSFDNSMGATRTVTINNISGDGTLAISVDAGSAIDAAGNQPDAIGPSQAFNVDNTAPTVTIGDPSVSITATSAVSFPVTYADANFGSSSLSAADVTLNTTGTATGTVSVTGSGTSYTVTVSSISGNGSLGISISAGTAIDAAGNVAPAAGPSGTFIVDNTPPTVAIGPPLRPITANSSETYAITYADDHFGSSILTAADVILNKTGTATGTVNVSGSGTAYVVTISGITGDGTLGISLAAGTATDQAGNPAPAAGPSGTFIVDNTPPSVTIGSPSKSITATSSVSYTVTYADAHFASSTLSTANVILNTTGTATGAVSVTGSGTSYVVTISSITGTGTLGISIAANTAVDLAGNLAQASGPSGTFIVDNTPPTITIGSPSALFTASNSVIYTVTYADPNFASSSLAAGNISLLATGTAIGTLGVTGSGTSYTVTVSNITGNGTLGISIAPNTAIDLAGNKALAAGPSTTFTVDNIAPTVSISTPSKSITNTGPVTYTLSYSDLNFGSSSLSTSDVHLVTTGTATGTLSFDNSTGATRTIIISNIQGDGTLGISIDAGAAVDLAGNPAPAISGSTFTVDNSPPVTTISGPFTTLGRAVTSTTAGPIKFTVTYVSPNLNVNSIALTAANIHLSSTNFSQGADINVSGTGTTRTVTISHITGGKGIMGISIGSGTAFDLAGNAATAATSATFSVLGAPRLTVTPSVAASVLPGGVLVYNFTITNRGSQTAVGVIVQETPPAGTLFSLANNPGWTFGPNGSFIINLGDLAVGASRTVRFRVTVPSTATPGTSLVDAVSVLDSLGREASTTLHTTIAKPTSGRWTPGR
jgi:autotransporter-associated beta strand protein